MTITGPQLNTLFLAFVVTWFLGTLLLGVRATRSGRAYLRRLAPLTGVHMTSYADQGWPGKDHRVRQAYREPQSDPELERMRQEARRRGRIALAWIVGYPAVVFGAVFLLVVTGAIRGRI